MGTQRANLKERVLCFSASKHPVCKKRILLRQERSHWGPCTLCCCGWLAGCLPTVICVHSTSGCVGAAASRHACMHVSTLGLICAPVPNPNTTHAACRCCWCNSSLLLTHARSPSTCCCNSTVHPYTHAANTATLRPDTHALYSDSHTPTHQRPPKRAHRPKTAVHATSGVPRNTYTFGRR